MGILESTGSSHGTSSLISVIIASIQQRRNPGVEKKNRHEKQILHMMGNAHIDPVWQWRWEEGRQEAIDTCRAALDRMEETQDFTFCRSSAAIYEWIETYDPELFDAIRKRIEEGRWHVVGGWWVQPDCNIPGGEALVRQALYAKLYFLEKFGKEVQCGYNVDTFGHAGSLPQILSKAGILYYCFFRPDPHEMRLPKTVFWWRSMDGSKVLASRAPGHYGTGPWEIEERIREAARGIEPELGEGMCFYGVGNHGGGPTKKNIECIQRLRDDPSLPELEFSSPENFFQRIQEKANLLPVVEQELQHHAPGCYSVHSRLKAANRHLEWALCWAEKISSFAEILCEEPYPQEGLTRSWKKLLFNQFHDILAGTSIRASYEDSMADYDEVRCVAQDATRTGRARISGKINCPGQGRPMIVYNPLSAPRRDIVEVEVTWPRQTNTLRVVDDQDNEVPCQQIFSAISGRGMAVRLAFLAEMPALGYRAYRVVEGEPSSGQGHLKAGHGYLENQRIRLAWNTPGEGILHLIWKDKGIDLLHGPGCVLTVLRDPSDTWSHAVKGYKDPTGSFQLMEASLLECGPVRCTARLVSQYGVSVLTQDISLYDGMDRVDVHAILDYSGQHEVLKLCVPVALKDPEATFEIPYGVAVREREGQEEPFQKWVDLSGTGEQGPMGLAVLNDSKYGCDVKDSEIRVTLQRSPIYCFHDPARVEPQQQYEYMDQGRGEFRYSLLPHEGDWRTGAVPFQSHCLNQPLTAREEPAHEGGLPSTLSFASFDSDSILIETVKRSEKGNRYVLRAHETHGKATKATLTFLGKKVAETSFHPCEIKTWLLNRQKEWTAIETDLLERPL